MGTARPEHQKIKEMLTEALLVLCQKGLEYQHQVSVEALIGVTLDHDNVCLVSINQVIQGDNTKSVENQPQQEITTNPDLITPKYELPEEDEDDVCIVGVDEASTQPMSFPHITNDMIPKSSTSTMSLGPDHIIPKYEPESEFNPPLNMFHPPSWAPPVGDTMQFQNPPVQYSDCKKEKNVNRFKKFPAQSKPHSQKTIIAKALKQKAIRPIKSGLKVDINIDPASVSQDPTAETVYRCKACGKALKSLNSFKQHMNTHLGLYKNQCNLCDSGFANARDLRSHMSMKHNAPKEYRCSHCGKDYAWYQTYKKHIKVCGQTLEPPAWTAPQL